MTATIEARAGTGFPTETGAGHATDHGRRIAEDLGAEMAKGTKGAGVTTLATVPGPGLMAVLILGA